MNTNGFALDDMTFEQILGTAALTPLDFELPMFDASATHDVPSAGTSPHDDSDTSGSEHDHHSSSRLKASSASLTQITEEERQMLAEDGVVIPENIITLTKSEERALKLVRRKLKNKISAQDSRRKKKEYVDGLESRVKECTAVNIDMAGKVNTLKRENDSLRQQLAHLRQIVSNLSGSASAATTGTVLMVIALSFSLFTNPAAVPMSTNTTSTMFSPSARTLKTIDAPLTDALVPTSNIAALRDALSSMLGMSKKDEAPPKLRSASLSPTTTTTLSSDSEL